MREQISRIGLFILGIIADGPTTPYTIDKILNYKRMKNMKVGVPFQTIYGIMYKFNKLGLVSRKRVKNGNLPDKTIYSITPKGKNLMKESLIYYLNKPPEILTELVLPIMMVGYLDKENAIRVLDEYQRIIGGEIRIGKKMRETSKELNESFTGKIFIEHILSSLNANRATVRQLIKTMEKEPLWTHSPVPWWRNEVEISKPVRRKARSIQARPKSETEELRSTEK
jgi:DNA-binding PadR family transcriptional regulator